MVSIFQLIEYNSFFFNYFVQKKSGERGIVYQQVYDVTLNEICIITTVSRKKDKTREYSLSTMSRSTVLLVVCSHASDGGYLPYSTLPPG